MADDSGKLERRRAAFAGCTRFLSGHGPRRVADTLRALADHADPELRADIYGTGPAIEELEAEVAELLGKPAAVFMPSGTMAQVIALRIHAERAGCGTVAFHPTCHLELHEQRGYAQLHQLSARLVGRRDRLMTRADLDAIAEPVAALLVELPQREIGGVLPTWDELASVVAWAEERDVSLHLDGARLWEAAPFYKRSLAELADPFDTVYVSFYKILGGIAGAALAGPADVIAEARIWQRRHGGNLISMYPFALSARLGLRQRLERMAAYRDRAVAVAAVLTALPGVRVNPDPPHTNMMHVYLPVEAERLLDASADVAAREGVALFTSCRPCDVPGYCCVELSIGDGADTIGDDELARLVGPLLDAAS